MCALIEHPFAGLPKFLNLIFKLFVNSLNLYVASEGIFVFELVAAIKPYTKVSLLKFSECLLVNYRCPNI